MNNKIFYLIAGSIVVILAFLFDSVAILTSAMMLFVIFQFQKRKSQRPLRILKQPYHLSELGIRTSNDPDYNQAIKQLIKHLDESLDPTMKDKVTSVFQSEKEIEPAIIENLWIEWKRFLILSTLIPSIHIYSEEVKVNNEEVQKIWKKLIDSTREDVAFQNKFYGINFTEHPNDHDPIAVTQKAKDWFSFLYTQLFHVTDCSRLIWEIYFSEPFEFGKLEDFRRLSIDELKGLFYLVVQHKNPLVEALTQHLIMQMKEQMKRLDEHANEYGKSIRKYKKKFRSWRRIPSEQRDFWSAQTALFFSLYHPEQFENYCHWINAHSRLVTKGEGGDEGGGGDGGGDGE